MAERKEELLSMMMPRNHTYQMILLVLFILIWVLDSFLFRITTILADMIPFWIPLIPAGLVLIYSAYLIDRSHKDLFDSEETGVITTGVFSKVRHPMYLGTTLVYLAIGVATLSLAAIALFIIIFGAYNAIANYEEKKLEEKFGPEYLDYKKRVSKWIPL